MNRYDKIWDYFREGCVGKEANHLEQEALSDPFLYEALEGLSDIAGEHSQIIKGLEDRIQRQTVKNNKRRVGWRWVAASVFLMGGIAVWLLNAPEEPLQVTAISQLADTVHRKPNEIIVGKNIGSQESVEIVNDETSLEGKKGKEEKEILRHVRIIKRLPFQESKGRMPETKKTPDTVEQVPLLSKAQPVSAALVDRASINIDTVFREREAHVLNTEESPVTVQYVKRKSAAVMTKSNKNLRTKSKQQLRGDDFEEYVKDSLRYPEDARLQKIEGEVVLSVHVNKRGRAARIKVVRKLSRSCDKEAIHLVEEYKGGWNVDVRDFTVRVRFSLTNTESY